MEPLLLASEYLSRMRLPIIALALLALGAPKAVAHAAVPACCQPMPPAPANAPAVLLQGIGHLHHPVMTAVPLAQVYFDQGLTQIYGFDQDGARRSFRKAAAIDPRSAMAWWGVALSWSPNINTDRSETRDRNGRAAIAEARAREAGASQSERAYIEALAMRFSLNGKESVSLDRRYATAMADLSTTYPDDLDAATLYAEALMVLHPWQYWKNDGSPGPDTPTILSVLEGVLKRDPNQVGANHYYIHAVEASPHPERGLPEADRLPGLAPGLGHLVHMPAHIYIRTGHYDWAATSNQAALRADAAYLKQTGQSETYYAHNIYFLNAAYLMLGNAGDSLATVARLRREFGDDDAFIAQATTLTRFAKWQDVLRLPRPARGAHEATAYWFYATATALAAQGKTDAARERLAQLTTAIAIVSPSASNGVNTTRTVLAIAQDVLAGRVAASARDWPAAISALRRAVAAQDDLDYDEPMDWYYPVRETLGGILLQSGDSVGAEAVFREDLTRYPNSGRSLFGLWQSLAAQGKSGEARNAHDDYLAAWKGADTTLTVAGL